MCILKNGSSCSNTVILPSSYEPLNYMLKDSTHILLEENIISGEFFLMFYFFEGVPMGEGQKEGTEDPKQTLH